MTATPSSDKGLSLLPLFSPSMHLSTGRSIVLLTLLSAIYFICYNFECSFSYSLTFTYSLVISNHSYLDISLSSFNYLSVFSANDSSSQLFAYFPHEIDCDRVFEGDKEYTKVRILLYVSPLSSVYIPECSSSSTKARQWFFGYELWGNSSQFAIRIIDRNSKCRQDLYLLPLMMNHTRLPMLKLSTRLVDLCSLVWTILTNHSDLQDYQFLEQQMWITYTRNNWYCFSIDLKVLLFFSLRFEKHFRLRQISDQRSHN